jgi:hypothetical protein
MKKYWYFAVIFSTDFKKDQHFVGKVSSSGEFFPIVYVDKMLEDNLNPSRNSSSTVLVVNTFEISEKDFKNNDCKYKFHFFA